jgi:CheY-like chemotaxis protein
MHNRPQYSNLQKTKRSGEGEIDQLRADLDPPVAHLVKGVFKIVREGGQILEVETANNGQAALDKLNSGIKPNLIVTDINMPVMGGLELIGKVRAMPGFKFIPILTLTTESDTAKPQTPCVYAPGRTFLMTLIRSSPDTGLTIQPVAPARLPSLGLSRVGRGLPRARRAQGG